jgi:hypothetical protein
MANCKIETNTENKQKWQSRENSNKTEILTDLINTI